MQQSVYEHLTACASSVTVLSYEPLSSIVASVPDLICVLDTGSGKNLGVPEFKYGYRVTVLGITCSPHWTTTEAGMKIGGPVAFGYNDIAYKPLGEYVEPRSVIAEFAPRGMQ